MENLGEHMTTLLADAGLEKANHAVAVIGARLTDTQVNVTELRSKLGKLALMSVIDPVEHEPELIEARTQLAASEASMRELGAAEQLAQTMARDAKEKALQASAQADWDAAGIALDEAVVSANALDAMARQFGDLYRRLQTELRRAVSLAAPHMARDDYRMLAQVPDLNETLKLVIANAGGPPVPEKNMMHLDVSERTSASVARQVERHRQQVMGFRPVDTTEKDSDHD
jgi:hypothetical protein